MPAVTFQFSTEGASDVLKSIKAIGAAQTKQAKDSIRFARSEETAKKIAAQRILREEIKSNALRQRFQDQQHRRALQNLQKQEREKQRIARRAGSNDSSFGKMTGAVAVGSMVSSLVSSAVSAAMSTVGAAARDSLALRESNNRLSIGARSAGQGFVDARQLDREMLQVSLGTGGVVSAQSISAGASSFVAKTGDLEAFRSSVSILATTAAATGASFEDVSAMAAELSSKFGLSGEALGDSLAQIVAAGKAGAFELKDAASLYGRAAAAGSAFGLRGNAGAQQLSGFLQIARSSTGSADQATTAVENVFSNLQSKAHILKKNNVTGTDLSSLIASSISKLDDRQLYQVFGEQGIRAINPLRTTYSETFKATSGNEAAKRAAAEAAVISQLKEAQGEVVSFAELQKDAAQASLTASAQLNQAWTTVVSAVSSSGLTDSLTTLATSFASLAVDNLSGLETAFAVLSLVVDDVSQALALLSDSLPKGDERKAIRESQKERHEMERSELEKLSDQRKHALRIGDQVALDAITNKERALRQSSKDLDKLDQNNLSSLTNESATNIKGAIYSSVIDAAIGPMSEVTSMFGGQTIGEKVSSMNVTDLFGSTNAAKSGIEGIGTSASTTIKDIEALGVSAANARRSLEEISKSKPIPDRTGG